MTCAEIDSRIEAGWTLSVAAHTLLETYSVLTRLPVTHRLRPEQALHVIQENLASAPTMALDSQAYWQLLQMCSAGQWTGGVVYDAILVALAKSNQIPLIITHNVRDFVRLADGEVQILRPR